MPRRVMHDHVDIDAVVAQGRGHGRRRRSRPSRAAGAGGCRRRSGPRSGRPGRPGARAPRVTASTLVKSEPGPRITWSASAMASTAPGAGSASAGTSDTHEIGPGGVLDHGPGPTTSAPGHVGLEARPAPAVAGSTRPAAPTRRAASASGAGEVAGHGGQAGDDQVAEGVALQLARSRSGTRRPGPTASRGRPAPPGTGAGRPGAGMPNASRSRPLEPPSSATDTMAVMSPA